MAKPVQKSDANEQELMELADREEKLRDKWVAFKKKLRATKGIDPDYADQKFREEEVKFERAMELINQQRDWIAKPERHPTEFCYEVGGFNCPCHRVEFKDGRLEYAEAPGAYLYRPAVVIKPVPGTWERFWRAVDCAGVVVSMMCGTRVVM